MMDRLKVYLMSNLDGTNRVGVAAKNLKTAAECIGCSVHSMRQMGWRFPNDDRDAPIVSLALAAPGKPFFRPIDARDDDEMYPWSDRRWYRGTGRIWRHGALRG